MKNNLLRMVMEMPAGRNALSPYGLKQYDTETTFGLMPYGLRHDASAPKGKGFFGPLRGKSGDVMTEYTVGVDINGKPMEIPTLVPTLTPDEINHLLSGGDVTDEIYKKAYGHAVDRMNKKRSPFRETGEFYY